jgi:hypothetical protein
MKLPLHFAPLATIILHYSFKYLGNGCGYHKIKDHIRTHVVFLGEAFVSLGDDQ